MSALSQQLLLASFILKFFTLFPHAVFDIGFPHKESQDILMTALKAVKATCSFAMNNGCFALTFLSGLCAWISLRYQPVYY